MDTYKNWIPIEFGEGNIVLWKAGFEGSSGLDRSTSTWQFCSNGILYLWPEDASAIPSTGERISVDPGEAPELALAILDHLLHKQFGSGLDKGNFPLPGFPVEFGDLRGRVSVHSTSGFKKPFFLLVSPAEENSGSNSFGTTKRIARALTRLTFSNSAGTAFKVLPFLELEHAYAGRTFRDPELSFRPGGIIDSPGKWRGLSKYGPHSVESYRERALDCLVIAPARHLGTAGRLLGELRDGIPEVHFGTHFPWPGPWTKTFQFKDFNWRKEITYSAGEFRRIGEICKNAVTGSKKPDLAFVFVESSEGELPPGEDPYILFKAAFLEYGIPTQMIRKETCDLPKKERAKALQNIALGAYVKCGGRPWLLAREKFLRHELVVGVGATPLRDGVAGFSMIFTKDGDFRLGNSSIKPGIGDWQSALGAFVADQIEILSREDNWQAGDPMDLTFHFAEELGVPDLKEIKMQILDRLKGRFKPEITFLFLRYNHGFRYWHPSRPGVRMADGSLSGEYQPFRGFYLAPDPENALLQLHVPEDPGLFNPPLHIYRHPESDGLDLDYLTEQIHRFSCISWRSFGHGTLPATLEYGNALTRLLEKFDRAGRAEAVERALISHPQKTWFL